MVTYKLPQPARETDKVVFKVEKIHELLEQYQKYLDTLLASRKLTKEDAEARAKVWFSMHVARFLMEHYEGSVQGYNRKYGLDDGPFIEWESVAMLIAQNEDLTRTKKGKAPGWASGDGRAGGHKPKVPFNDAEKAIISGLAACLAERIRKKGEARGIVIQLISATWNLEVTEETIRAWMKKYNNLENTQFSAIARAAQQGQVGAAQISWEGVEKDESIKAFSAFFTRLMKGWKKNRKNNLKYQYLK